MPEIKHNFTSGKMNKDLDERLVPNGEYRDAMNVEVLSSEGSDVGTVQNILGNEEVPVDIKNQQNPFNMPSGAKTIGTIADEKTDTLYYLVTSEFRDMIFGCKRKGFPFFVFVDMRKDTLKFTSDTVITGINVIDNMLFWTDNVTEPKKINIDRCREGTAINGNFHTKLINEAAGIDLSSGILMEEKHITVIKKTPSKPPTMKLETFRDPTKYYTGVVVVEENDGGFNGSSLGFVTSAGNLANGGDIYNFNTIDYSDDNNNTLFMQILEAITPSGDLVPITNINELEGWAVGEKLLFKAFENPLDPNDAPGLPITDYVLKGEIEQVFTDSIQVRFTSQDGQPPLPDGTTIPPQTQLKYAVDLYSEDEKLFEFKFPRFSYRYKYEDGEYSSFAPFTQVAFAPGAFDYHPRKGYNIGMTNRLKDVRLSDFISNEMDKDIVSVDILFKDESSPMVYVVDTLSANDAPRAGFGENYWNSILNGTLDFIINNETINSVVPSNQLLRPWDNVPRRALAQEVTGNRIVYGNYVQNINLLVSDPLNPDNKIKYYADFKPDWTEFEPTGSEAVRSCKSLREYQLGVVFTDKYGRETPVISNASGTLKLPKKDGEKANRIKAGLKGLTPPESATHLKWFVKETSNEYYNMAMDRWYFAEDGNIWLAFPSSDRNKLDIDTFLILKKGTDSNELVQDAARYKVLAIESEAPEFIKTSQLLASSEKHFPPSNFDAASGVFLNPGNPLFEPNTTEGIPFAGGDVFTLLYEQYKNSAGRALHEYTDGDLFVDFGLVGDDEKSDKYKVVSLSCSRDFSNPLDDDVFSFQLQKPFGNDVNFILDGTPNAPTGVKEGAIVNIYKHFPENLPQFDGKFFVKIYFDEIFKNNIERTFLTGSSYRIVDSNMVYRLKRGYIEQFTHRMSWFWTPAKLLAAAPGGNISTTLGTRDSSTDPYSWRDFDNNGKFFYEFYRTGGTTLTDQDHARSGISGRQYANNTLGFPAGNTIPYTNFRYTGAHYGFMESDKYAACNIWFKRFVPRDYFANSWHKYGIETYRNCFYSGSGDKRDINNWTKSEWTQQRHGPQTIGGTWVGSAETDDEQEQDFSEARDAEVWFIDEGRVYGRRHDSSAPIGPRGDGKWSDGSEIYQKNFLNLSVNEVEHPDGIGTFSNSWKMALSFGGIGGVDYHQGKINENHFNVGAWNLQTGESANSRYDDLETVNFVQRLNPGNRFRWKNDPTKTIYNMPSDISSRNYLRHSVRTHRPDAVNNDHWIYPEAETVGMSVALHMAHSHNWTKNWRFNGITPALAWDPSEEGRITGGLRINLTICDENGGTGVPTSSGDPDQPNGNDTAIYVSNIVPTAGKSNFFNEGNPPLHEGMALHQWDAVSGATKTYADFSGFLTTASGKSKGNNFLVVRKIEQQTNGSTIFYKLTLGGYNFPMQNRDHEWLYKAGRQNSPLAGGEYRFVQVGMNGQSANSEFNINNLGYKLSVEGYNFKAPDQVYYQTYHRKINGQALGKIGAVGYELQFVEEVKPLETMSENPAIWETEPKESKDLDIYYEASETIPINFNESNIYEAFPVGSILSSGPLAGSAFQFNVIGYDDMNIEVDADASGDMIAGNNYHVTLPSGLYFGYTVNGTSTVSGKFYVEINPSLYNANFFLNYHNCYSFGNGVESNRIRDNYNLPFILNGVKASTTLDQEYKEEHRKYGLIYSGLYNSTSGINNLNQFIQAEKITKDVNPIYGSIQKLHSRNSDLVTLCEDKILKILANKDAVFNADGNSQLTATENVLGQTIPFRGEYGISTNPESFASESYRAYFSDKVRGTIMRLSVDGLTPISDYGMKDYFRDNLKISTKVIGSYDDRNDEYNVKLQMPNSSDSKVITYSEKVKGWVSFKSFIQMENGISMANDYYTFKDAKLFKHYIEDVSRNRFYGEFTESTIDVLLNDNPGLVKVFNTLNYEGSQSKIAKFSSQILNIPLQPNVRYTDQTYYNLNDKKGWYVESIITDKEEGNIKEFIEKEGKWFNNIDRLIDISLEGSDTGDFTFQGIGILERVEPGVTGIGIACLPIEAELTIATGFISTLTFLIPDSIPGAGVPEEYNFYNWSVSGPGGYFEQGSSSNPPLDIDHATLVSAGGGKWELIVDFYFTTGSCRSTSDLKANLGCMNPNATNYSSLVNVDNGSCILPPVPGCMDPNALNYNPNATVNDNSCTYTIGVGGS